MQSYQAQEENKENKENKQEQEQQQGQEQEQQQETDPRAFEEQAFNPRSSRCIQHTQSTNSKSFEISGIVGLKKKKRKKKYGTLPPNPSQIQVISESTDVAQVQKQKEIIENRPQPNLILIKEDVDQSARNLPHSQTQRINTMTLDVYDPYSTPETKPSKWRVYGLHPALVSNIIYFAILCSIQIGQDYLQLQTCWCQSLTQACYCDNSYLLSKVFFAIRVLGLSLGPLQFSYDLLASLWVCADSKVRRAHLRNLYKPKHRPLNKSDTPTPWTFKDPGNLFLILFGYSCVIELAVLVMLDSSYGQLQLLGIQWATMVIITVYLLFQKSGQLAETQDFLCELVNYAKYSLNIVQPMCVYLFLIPQLKSKTERYILQIIAIIGSYIFSNFNREILTPENMIKYALIQFYILDGIFIGNYVSSSYQDVIFWLTLCLQLGFSLDARTYFFRKPLRALHARFTNRRLDRMSTNYQLQLESWEKELNGMYRETYLLILPMFFYIFYGKLMQICQLPTLAPIQQNCQYQNTLFDTQALWVASTTFMSVKVLVEILALFCLDREHQIMSLQLNNHSNTAENYLFRSLSYGCFEMVFVCTLASINNV